MRLSPDDGMYEVPGNRLRELRDAEARVGQLETALRGVGEWLSQMEGRTVTAADLDAILPDLERAALDGGTDSVIDKVKRNPGGSA